MFDDKIRRCVRAPPHAGRLPRTSGSPPPPHPPSTLSRFFPPPCPRLLTPSPFPPRVSLRDWVTGYGKRKTQRRKYAVKQAEEKARRERLQERKERREEMRHNLGLDRPEPEPEPVVGAVETEVVEYGSGVTVTVEGID